MASSQHHGSLAPGHPGRGLIVGLGSCFDVAEPLSVLLPKEGRTQHLLPGLSSAWDQGTKTGGGGSQLGLKSQMDPAEGTPMACCKPEAGGFFPAIYTPLGEGLPSSKATASPRAGVDQLSCTYSFQPLLSLCKQHGGPAGDNQGEHLPPLEGPLPRPSHRFHIHSSTFFFF